MFRRFHLLALLALSVAGCGAMVTGLQKVATDAATHTTKDLSDVNVQIHYLRGLYPAALNTYNVHTFPNIWKDGADLVYLELGRATGVAPVKIDGVVKIDGTPVEPLTGGFYAKVVSGEGPHTATLEAGGSTESWKIAVPKPLKIVSVNGGQPIDLQKDFTLEIEPPPDAAGIRVALLQQEGAGVMQSYIGFLWGDVGIYKPSKTIHVPAGAFVHAAADRKWLALPLSAGPTTLLVEAFQTHRSGRGLAVTELVSRACATAPVVLTGDTPKISKGFGANGNIDDITWFAMKRFGYWSRPFGRVPRVALVAMQAERLLARDYSVEQTDRTYVTHTCMRPGDPSSCGDYRITDKTKYSGTAVFPSMGKGAWENLYEAAVTGVSAELKKQGIEVVGPEAVIASKAGKALIKDAGSGVVRVISLFDDPTKQHDSATYRGTPAVMADRDGRTFFDNMLGNAKYAQSMTLLMDELHVDGVVGIVLNVEMAPIGSNVTIEKHGDKAAVTVDHNALQGNLEVTVQARPNGFGLWPTDVVGSLKVWIPRGADLESLGGSGQPHALETMLRIPTVVRAIGDGLAALRAEEEKGGLRELWTDAAR